MKISRNEAFGLAAIGSILYLGYSLYKSKKELKAAEKQYTTDLQTEAQYFEKMLQTGIYTVNELRVKKGQPPVEGGDIPLVSANLKGLDVVLAESKQTNNTTDGEE